LRFTRLRLSGFKSFVDPTELHIEHGLSGVVGPNGCGKSNLLEALRWVMGENRPTSMRGTGMEDVIFGGTGSRPMRNHAEVTLVIDNSNRTAPSPYNEMETIEVTRRIERDAGSVYRINGREVRQRDVQIFFADASTGSASPALVRQGQISILINQKPLARRAILEEAAGIAGLHQRRHEAELRLKGAEANMARLDDIIAEVETQLQGLKRQARQASRYRNLSGLIRRAEALAFLLRWQSAEEQHAAAEKALAETSAVVRNRTERAAQASTARLEAANALPPLRQQEAEKSAALQRLLHERDTLEAEEARAREDAQRLRQRLAHAQDDRTRERALEQDAEHALERLETESKTLEEAAARAEADLATAENRAQDLKISLADRERLLEKLAASLADLNATRLSYERARNEAHAQVTQAKAQLEALAPRLSDAEAEISSAPSVHAAETQVEQARGAASEARDAADLAGKQLDAAREAEAAARAPLEAAEREVQRIAAEAAALTKLLRRGSQDLWPPVIDALRVQPGYEAALAAALGDDLDAPLDEAAPQHWRDLGGLEPPALPDDAVPLSQFVEAPAALARRLAFTGVIARAEGGRAQTALTAGQRLVSREGDFWRWDGYRMSAEAESPAAIRLEQRNRLESLEGELAEAKSERSAVHAFYVAAQHKTESARHEAQTMAQESRQREAALVAAQDHATRVARMAAERAARLATLEAELRNWKQAHENARRAEQEAAEALSALADPSRLAEELAEARNAATEVRAGTGQALASLENLRNAAAARAERLAIVAEERERWTVRRDAARNKLNELASRVEGMTGELEILEATPEKLAARRAALLDAVTTADNARKAVADARAEAETLLAEADRVARAADAELSSAREERAGAEARTEGAAARMAELKQRIRDELDAVPEELPQRAELKSDAEPMPLDQAEKRVEKLKAEREALGGVNLRAEEEANEHEQRLTSLQNDRADLAGAIERLRRGIQSLNREGRERLIASFDKVNANFERLFKELFQGGEARLTFTESEDPLEAGLEILARPPGKKLTTLSLLSGGEQALTAISLIFAVFLVNPAPICVLDEVDAPLDDANVDRFCRLLDEMTRMAETRYLIITHHALTMSRMDRLFGVTMTERGVSQLVSVSLAEAERVVAA
jgi:chromosome segregation protein